MHQNEFYENSSNSSANSGLKLVYNQKTSQYTHFRQAMCAFHPENFIMNFCKNPQCLMPMCSECVKIHQLEHAKAGTHGNFETIEAVGQQCQSELKTMHKTLKKQQQKIKKFENTVDEQNEMIFDSLKQTKKRTKKVIDDYFTQIEKQIKTKLMTQKANHQQQLGVVGTKINEKQKEISQVLKKITQEDSFLKYIIQYYSSNHQLDINMLEQELHNSVSVLATQFMNLQTNEAVLQNIANTLPNFLFLKNGNINNSMRSSSVGVPFALTPQIQVTPAPQIIQQSISKISPLKSPLRTSNVWNTTRNNFLQPQQYIGVQAGQNRSFYNPNQSMRIQYK